MKAITTKIDSYFLSDNPKDITPQDRLMFYGFYLVFAVMSILFALKLYTNII